MQVLKSSRSYPRQAVMIGALGRPWSFELSAKAGQPNDEITDQRFVGRQFSQNADADGQLFLNLAAQGLSCALSVLDLAPWEFPTPTRGLSWATSTREELISVLNHGCHNPEHNGHGTTVVAAGAPRAPG